MLDCVNKVDGDLRAIGSLVIVADGVLLERLNNWHLCLCWGGRGRGGISWGVERGGEVSRYYDVPTARKTHALPNLPT